MVVFDPFSDNGLLFTSFDIYCSYVFLSNARTTKLYVISVNKISLILS